MLSEAGLICELLPPAATFMMIGAALALVVNDPDPGLSSALLGLELPDAEGREPSHDR